MICVWRGARADDADSRKTVVVFGDSQAAGLARGLQRVLVESPLYKVLNRTHAGAALVHNEREWLLPVERFTANEKADIAVVMLGANDRLDLRSDDGKYLHFRTDEWRQAYAARTDEILQLLVKAGLRVIWCGNPVARSDVYSDDMQYINGIFAEEAAKFGAKYVPLWTVVADDQGHYSAFGKDRDGTTRRLRADDGIHFTAPGYELIAEKVIGLLAAPPDAGQSVARAHETIQTKFGQIDVAPATPIPAAAARPPVVPAQSGQPPAR